MGNHESWGRTQNNTANIRHLCFHLEEVVIHQHHIFHIHAYLGNHGPNLSVNAGPTLPRCYEKNYTLTNIMLMRQW